MSRTKGDGRGRLGGGRKAGTPNKTTKEMRELMKKFTQENFEDFVDTYKAIEDPEKKADIYLKTVRYVLPLLSSVEVSGEDVTKSFAEELHKMAEDTEAKK